ncbi:MAG TPA: SRPBCC family protein [Planctomycetaceae bacterium]
MTAPPPSRPRRPVWMTALLVVALIVGLFNIGVYVYGLTLPNEWRVEESVVVAAPPEAVYPLLATPKRWAEWSAWSAERDPSLKFAYDGPEAGKGASFSWLGERLGHGKIVLTEAKPGESIRYELVLQGETFSENGRIALEPTEEGTRVTWTDGGELDGTLGRLFRERLEASVAAEFAASLERLKGVAEGSEFEGTAELTNGTKKDR